MLTTLPCRFAAAAAFLILLLLTLPPFAARAQKDLRDDTPGAGRADENVTKRAALVIGNTNYEYKPLKNPKNDAHDMAMALTKLGFKVTLKYDMTLVDMREIVNAWADSLDTHTLALVYYSGHGVTNEGQNYFVPVNNAAIKHKRDVPDLAYPFQRLLDATKESGCPLRIFILDACRNDPLPRGLRGDEVGQSGLVKVNAPSGAFIAYAAGFGETASDNGDGANGLYTAALLKNIQTPGLPIESLFKRVRGTVLQASRGEQHPDESSQLVGEFSFTGAVVPPLPTPTPPNKPVPVVPKPKPNKPVVVKPAPPAPVVPKKSVLGSDAIELKDAHIAFIPLPGYAIIPKNELPPQMQIPQMVFVYLGQETNGFAVNINLIVETAPPGQKADLAAVESLAKMMAAQVPSYRKKETKALVVAGEAAAMLSGTSLQQGTESQNKQVLIVHNGKAYSFTFTAPASEFAKQVGAFDKMIESIEWR